MLDAPKNEGVEEGRQKGHFEIAQKMLSRGLLIDEIIPITALSKEEILTHLYQVPKD